MTEPTLGPLLVLNERELAHCLALVPTPTLGELVVLTEEEEATEILLAELAAQRAAVAERDDQIAALRAVTRQVYEAVYNLHGNAEDCDTCGALCDAKEDSPCALHGPEVKATYQALCCIEDVLGPC